MTLTWSGAANLPQFPFGRLFRRLDRPVPEGAGIVTAYTDGQVTLRSNRAKVGYHEAADLSGFKGIQVGDFVVHGLDILRGSVGIADSSGAITAVCAVCEPVVDLDLRYVAHVIRVQAGSGFTRALARGIREGGADFRRWGTLAELPIPMPPVEYQRAVCDYLDCETARVDTLIEEQQRLIEMLRERRTAVVAHVTSQGSDVEFRRVISELRQGWSPNCENWPADGVAEWGVLKVGCANTGRFAPTENKRLPDDETARPEFAVRQDELVMSRSNTKDLVGAAAVVDGDYPRLLLSDLTYGISLEADADPAFVAYALASPALRVQISTASKGMSHSMQKISQRDIRELRLQLPALDEQRRIAAYLDAEVGKIDALIAETERFIELSRERRSALITAAVTGQIDVRTVA